MTTALITGITGFVGSHLAEYLLKNTDWNIAGMIRWRSPLDNIQSLVPLINEGKRVRLVYGDLTDSISIHRAVADADADYIFHLAAQSYPQASFTAPVQTLDVNGTGTIRLLDAVLNHKRTLKPWVHVCSSSEVYGRTKIVPITEDAPFHPASPYAVSKVTADLMARHYAEAYGMNVAVSRMFTHTGPKRGDVFAESTFAKQIAMIEAGLIPPVVKVGNLDSTRTIADVRDAVRAYHMLVTVNPVPGEVYNIGGTHTCTIGDILEHLRGLSSVPCEIQTDQARLRPVDADNQIPSTEKFRRQTGWQAEIPFEKTMSDLLDYWRDKARQGPALQR